MPVRPLFGYLLARLRNFRGSERGNVLITFALATIPVIAFVGAAVDYSRGNSAKAAMQSAIDSTGLILSKTAKGMNQEQLNQKSREVFLALFNRSEVTNLVITPHYTTPTDSSFKLEISVTGTVPTTFTKIVGHETMELSVQTEIAWGLKKLELALALDVTGSMNSNNKMTELKKAAKSLLTTLKGAAKKDGDIKVAIVPFAVVVNAGAANVAAASLDWSDWSSEPAIMTTWLATQSNKNAWDRLRPGSSCPFTTSNHGFQCTNGPASKTNESTVSTIPTSGTYASLICPSRDNGSKSTAATGLLSNRYYSGCYTTTEKTNTNDWHPVATGSSASCGSLSSNNCQCSGGTGSNRVCAFRPDQPASNWQPLAMGSSMSCGNLDSPSVCQCTGSGSSKVCRQKAYDHVWRPSPKTAWDGCVRDRNQNFDVENTAPSFVGSNVTKTNLSGQPEDYRTATTPTTADAFQPFQYSTCPAATLPLTSNWTTLETKIDELAPAGNTNVTIGLSWAFHALTPADPLPGAGVISPDLKKVIILLTDGDNTQNRWSTSGADIDLRTQAACTKVKDAAIELWTIRVINGNAALLQACATQPSSTFYKNVQDATQLNDVFADIAKALTNLRISR